MTTPDTQARLTTPTGGAMSQPSSPKQWHGHPYVWSWYVCLASLDVAFIEARCKEAADDGAPANAAYKTGPKDPVEPNTWITVGQLGDDNRDRVRDYGLALLKWEEDLKAYRRAQAVQPVSQMQHEPAEAPAAVEPAEVPAAAEDTATPSLPTDGRGVRVIQRRPQE